MGRECGKGLLFGVAALLWATHTLAFAQGPDTLWTKTYGGLSDDSGACVQLTSDDGYIVVGRTESFGAGNSDVYLLKTDGSGDTLWTRTYGGMNEDVGFSVQETSDGGYVIIGYTRSFGPERYDVYLIKTNAYGDTTWTKTYGGIWSDQGWSVEQTSDGGYILGGCTEVELRGDAYLIKTDTDGDVMWTRTYGGDPTEWATAVHVTSDGGYILAGFTGYIPNWDVYLLRTDKDGNALWAKVYGGPYDDVAMSVQQTPDDGYVVAGWTGSFGAGSMDVWLLRTDANGDTLWTKTYGGINEDKGRSIQQVSGGGYIIAGSTLSSGAGEGDVYLLKTDADGDTLWSKTYGGIELERGASVQETYDGAYVITGLTCSFGAGGPDVYLIKTEPDVGTTENQIPRSGIRVPSIEAFPNPFRARTEISLPMPDPGRQKSEHRTRSPDLHLRIYDVSGRLVKDFTLPTVYSLLPAAVSWNGGDNTGERVSSGVYVLTFEAGRCRASTKLLVLE